jgi:uncharacterized protein YkwD
MTLLSQISLTVMLLTLGAMASAQERELRVINDLRLRECPNRLGKLPELKLHTKLNGAARHVNEGLPMREALKRADYRADQSAEIQLTGIKDDVALRSMLVKNFCSTLVNPGLIEVGIARRSLDVAIVFAAPFAPPASTDAAKVSQEVLKLVNEARSKPRRCGAKRFDAVPPLVLNDKLRLAAIAHANDMARHGEVIHEGSDGSSPDQRATRAGYRWKAVGENVAGGHLTAKEVVDGWLTSPHHCENIMDKDFTEMGVAFTVNSKQSVGIFWAQEFGRPRGK